MQTIIRLSLVISTSKKVLKERDNMRWNDGKLMQANIFVFFASITKKYIFIFRRDESTTIFFFSSASILQAEL